MSVSIQYRAATIEHMSRIYALKSIGIPDEIIHTLTESFNRTCALAQQSHDLAYKQGYMDGEKDPMTNLPRRGGLKMQFESEDNRKRHNPNGKNYALIFDVERLKPVNDNPLLGNSTGDDMIIAMGNIVHAVTRNEDLKARIGGDEFVALLMNTESDFANIEMPRRIIEAHKKMGCINSPLGPLPFNFRYTTIELPEDANYNEIVQLLDPKKDTSKRNIQHAHRELADYSP